MKKRIDIALLRTSLAAFMLLTVAACSNDVEEKEEKPEKTAEQLYTEGREAFGKGSYIKAVEAFDEVERQHPHSEWSPRAQIMAGYSYYKAQEYDDTILTLRRFLKFHPGSESAAYASYLIALSFYEQISDVARDQGMTEQAMQSLREVVKRYPSSEYARDADLKLDLTTDHLAGKEMMVGRYYLKRDEYISAVNRFKKVLDDYQRTTHTAEALHRLVETYLKLGVLDEAKRYAAVLGHNFPDSSWYRHSYELLKGDIPEQNDVEKVG